MPCFCSLTRTHRNFHIISLLNDSTGWKWSSRSVPKPLSSLPNVARKKAWSALLRSDDYDQFNGAVDRACRAYLVVAELEITRMDNIPGDGDSTFMLKGGATPLPVSDCIVIM
jgi:hypothetical protein